jgi:cellulose synthase (UDP-forming)
VNPALFLPGDNQLNLRLIAHYARDCEDPFHSSLWANVSNVQSSFDLTIQSLPKVPDLSALPGPFFDKYDNGALHLPFVFASAPSMAIWRQPPASPPGWAASLPIAVLPSSRSPAICPPAMPWSS